jgi:outer membrane protein
MKHSYGHQPSVHKSVNAARMSACATPRCKISELAARRRATPRRTLAIACVLLQVCGMRAWAQDQLLGPGPGPGASRGPAILRPYIAPVVAPARLANSSRLHDLIRAGQLYLTVRDALALAVENNLELEVQRYEPLAADWSLLRLQGGGALRGASGNSAQVGAVASGQGVIGSEASAGQSSGSSGGGGSTGQNNQIQQIGLQVPSYDPVLTNSTTFSHTTTLEPVLSVSEVAALVDNIRVYQTQISQGLQTGGQVQISQTENYLNENSPGDSINPSSYPRVSALVYQRFFQGAGITANMYLIREAKNNVRAARESFRSQLLDLAANVLNLYWNVVSANESVRAAERALEIAQKFDDDTRERVRLGVLAGYQIPRADAELARQRQALALAQMLEQQSEQPLKEAISRGEDPLLDTARIVPLERIEIPATDDLPPLRELVAKAMTGRPDLAVARINDENAAIRTVGTTNPLLPSGIVYAQSWNSGASGGLGAAFGQVVRRDYPSQSAGVYISAPLGNRSAQSDYGIDQLQLQQAALSSQRNKNQIATDISNQVVALKQARAGYESAVSARELQEQLLQAEQDRFSFGSSSIDKIVLAQRALVGAQSAEVAARGAYAHARVSLDQMVGATLEVNRLTLEEGESGRIGRESKLPEGLP